MMVHLKERFGFFFHNRWLVFVVAMWIQTFAGIGYLFGSISPIIKSSLNYNQKQIARLGVAKDLGDSVGFLAGTLCEILPLWAALLVGAIQNFIGYGWVWLIVTGRTFPLPLWAVSILLLFSLNLLLFVKGILLFFLVHLFHVCSGIIKSKVLLCQTQTICVVLLHLVGLFAFASVRIYVLLVQFASTENFLHN